MAVAFVGSGYNQSGTLGTVTIPTHSVGDLLLQAAHSNSAGTMTPPAGWDIVVRDTAIGPGITVISKIATATNDTSGTWGTTVHSIASAVYSGAGVPMATATNLGTSINSTFPALTRFWTDNTSWGVRIGVHTSSSVATPSGYTAREGLFTSTVYFFDTNGTISSNPTADTVTGTGGPTAWKTVTIEVGVPYLPPSSRVQVRTSSGWSRANVKKWNGSAWVAAKPQRRILGAWY